MFDDQQQPTANVPSNLPVAPEPQDMFAGVEDRAAMEPQTPDALRAGLLKKKTSDGTSTSAPSAPMHTVPMSQPILGKVILFVVAAVVVGGLGFGGWWIYMKVTQPAVVVTEGATPVTTDTVGDTSVPVGVGATEQGANTTPTEFPGVVTNTTEITNDVTTDTLLFGQIIDTDKDGLDDIREQEVGTNVNNSDTDNDGLSDGEEVITWKTNPLNKDTDGDGYEDGSEIQNGYNPAGPGKLTPSPATTTTSTTK